MIIKKSEQKRKLIMSVAKEIFIRKGFSAVTMKDIIEECNISRGGIYIYFQSVDEIFLSVILLHGEEKLKEAKNRLLEDKSFNTLIENYFEKQKKRLLNINKTLLIAMYEYMFSHKSDYDKEFFENQFLNTKSIVLNLLKYGAKNAEISCSDLENLASTIVFCIEGISMLGTTAHISEEFIDSQIEYIKKLIYKQYGITN